MSMNWMGGINHKNYQRPTSYTNNIHSHVPDSKYQGVAAYFAYTLLVLYHYNKF